MVCIFTYTWLICMVNVRKYRHTCILYWDDIFNPERSVVRRDGRSCFKPSKIRNHGGGRWDQCMASCGCKKCIILKRDINSHPWKIHMSPQKKWLKRENGHPWNGKMYTPETGKLHPWKWTWNPKMKVWKMLVLFKEVISGSMSIFHHVPMSRWGLA